MIIAAPLVNNVVKQDEMSVLSGPQLGYVKPQL